MEKRELISKLGSIRKELMEKSSAVLNRSDIEDEAAMELMNVIFSADDRLQDFSEELSRYMEA